MYAVAFYDMAEGAMSRIPDIYPRHRAFLDEFAKSGEILLIGPFLDPVNDGAMTVFRTREAAERFRDGDPFIHEGLVARARILDWDPLDFTGTQ
ncbi:YciI family protein [Amnibacterium sp.]|uniref:YciI family protein n=1 Tax=Amnibacterium sp. TaxID=1872496 RepID=UPI003F7C6B0F